MGSSPLSLLPFALALVGLSAGVATAGPETGVLWAIFAFFVGKIIQSMVWMV